MDVFISFPELCAICLVSLFTFWFAYRWILFNYLSYPPGPIGFPIVGYVGVLRDEPYKVFVELSKKYGKIFSLYLGPKYTVIITDYEIAKEVLSQPATLSRPDDAFDFVPGRGGFGGHNGTEWQEQRRFCVSTMRNLGMGKGPWENLIQDEIVDFVGEIYDWDGKPVDIFSKLESVISSNNTSLLIGRRLTMKENPEILHLLEKVTIALAQHYNSTNLSVLVPWLAKYLARLHIGEYHEKSVTLNEFANMFRREIAKHVENKKEDYADDFIGHYLKEMDKQNSSDKLHHFSVENLIGHLIVLFFAGSDTTATSVKWMLVLMASYPEVQKRVHEELDEVIGKNVQITWTDRKHLPYTMAVILEMERYSAINRLFPVRIAHKTVEYGGYIIPKGSRIIVNSWAVMHDSKYWNDPMEFIPERFLKIDGKDPAKTPGLSIFSFGKRNCPGDNVALMTIFLYSTALLQKFSVEAPSGCVADLRDDGLGGIITSPTKQKLCFIKR